MNINKLHLLRRSCFILSFLFLGNMVAHAEGDTPSLKISAIAANTCSDENQIIKITDIPEGPSLFVVAGVSYTNKSAYCEVNIEVFQPGRLDYSLNTIKGEILFREHKRLAQGPNQVGISFADCPNGIYHLDMELVQEKKTLIIEKTSDNRIKASLVSLVE